MSFISFQPQLIKIQDINKEHPVPAEVVSNEAVEGQEGPAVFQNYKFSITSDNVFQGEETVKKPERRRSAAFSHDNSNQSIMNQITALWHKYDTNYEMKLDKFETKAFQSDLLRQNNMNLPSDDEFDGLYKQFQNIDGYMQKDNIEKFVSNIIKLKQSGSSLA